MEKPMCCELCGEPMPYGEEMFKVHGYSGPCPKPPQEKNITINDVIEVMWSAHRPDLVEKIRDLETSLAAEVKAREEAEAKLEVSLSAFEGLRDKLALSEAGASVMREALLICKCETPISLIVNGWVHKKSCDCFICEALSSTAGTALLSRLEAAEKVCEAAQKITMYNPTSESAQSMLTLCEALKSWRDAREKNNP